ncbi:MAG TPA: serine hydrolase [Bacteroidota bacterium]|nr:serine hydrolase [Bacteroidota bacterium]
MRGMEYRRRLRRSLRTAARLAGILVLLVPLRAQADDIMAELRALNARFGGHLGLMAKNLATGDTVAYNADDRFPTASTIKLPVMTAYFDLVRRGVVDPATRITLRREDKKPGSGILQHLDVGDVITLRDAVTLMITMSDNTGTNLVLDHLAATHEERMARVNDFIAAQGLRDTRLLNRLYSLETKPATPEGMRYGIGVSTPGDMARLMELLYTRRIADSASCAAMIAILNDQYYESIVPRLLPQSACASFAVAHKTGDLNETKADVALVLSDRVNFTIAIYVDKSPDHLDDNADAATLLGAYAARAVWNHFTGMSGYDRGPVNTADVDWTWFRGGKWAIYRSPFAPFPHPARMQGYKRSDGTFYPWFPNYADSSIVVVVPDGFHPTPEGTNLIVHFHGWQNDDLGVLERYLLPQAMIAEKTNAILVIPQGPYRAKDSFGGKMEDTLGFRHLVEDVMATMQREKVVPTAAVARLIVTAHSGGGRPAGFVLAKGGMAGLVTDVFLFDALYEQQEKFAGWLLHGKGRMYAAYTEHLRKSHAEFAADVAAAGDRWSMTPSTVEHDQVPQAYFARWLATLPPEWKLTPTH